MTASLSREMHRRNRRNGSAGLVVGLLFHPFYEEKLRINDEKQHKNERKQQESEENLQKDEENLQQDEENQRYNVENIQMNAEKQHKKEEKLRENEEILPQKGIHIGKTLRRLLEKQGTSSVALGKRIGRSERAVQAMLRKKHLHSKVMVQISNALKHDIIRYLYQPDLLPANQALQKKAEALQHENEELKKELKYLKEINTMLKNK